MSARLRTATDAEMEAIWPAVSSAHLFSTEEAFREWRDEAPWRFQMNDAGDAVVLERWREHLDVLSIRSMWCPPRRLPDVLDGVRAIASDHGLARVMSPLVDVSAARPYLRTGMEECDRLVALQGRVTRVRRSMPPQGVALRRATPDDIEDIAALERATFDGFWRRGASEIECSIRSDRAVVARTAADLVGYTLSTVSRGAGTLGRLAVAEEARCIGIGRALVADVAAGFERQGVMMMALCTQRANRASRALYAACGLRELPGTLVFAIDPITVDRRGGGRRSA